MDTNADILIWNKRVGTVSWRDDVRQASFVYDARFKGTGLELSPIVMPTIPNTRYIFGRRGEDPENFRGLPGLLADSLPDKFGSTIISDWLATTGRITPLNPVEMLCYIGSRGMGALEYKPAHPGISDSSQRLDIERLANLAQLALSNEHDFRAAIKNNSEGLQDILKVGTSAGGAKAKAIVAYNENTGEFRSGKADAGKGFDYYIIKFSAEENGINLSRLEYAYYLMVKDCGVEMSECRLRDEGEGAHFFTKRFDRENGEKLHMQSLAALQHWDYGVGGYSYERIFGTLRALNLPYGDKEQLFRRMVFNATARNQDDHVKNFSFLMDKSGTWSLSPAYDMTYAFDPTGRYTAVHQTSINGKRANITQEDFLAVAKREGVNKPQKIVDQIWEVVAQWPSYAAKAGITPSQTKAIESVLLTTETRSKAQPSPMLAKIIADTSKNAAREEQPARQRNNSPKL